MRHPILFLTLALLVLAGAGARAQDGVARAEAGDFAWPNLTDMLTRLIAEVGPPIKVYKLVIDADSKVELWIQDQRQRDFIDRWHYDHGTLRGPTPVKFKEYPSRAALDHHVIELLEIDFPRLPAMLASARKRLDLPTAQVTGIELERGDSSGVISLTDSPIWTFHLATPRHDGRVEFSLKGTVLHVDKD